MGINEIIKIGNRIKELRKSKGISQKEMSKILDIPYSTYSNYENNNREPSVELIEKISEVLGVSKFDLLYDTEKLKAELDLIDKHAEYVQMNELKKSEEYKKLYENISYVLDEFNYFTPEYEEQTEDYFDETTITVTGPHDEDILTINQSKYIELGERMLSDIEKYKKMRILYFLNELKDEEK